MMRRVFFSVVTTLLLFARGADSFAAPDTPPMRVVQVDLDYVYDADPAQLERNLENLVTRIRAMNISAVFLQAFADPKGTGLASALYFPNKSLPVQADLFGRAVRELQTRANVKVFGWLPVLSFDLGDDISPVLAWDPATDKAERDPKAYRRLSPFDMNARAKISEIYEDMAREAPIDGILFHDDAMLSDFEDASPSALKAYSRAGFPASIKEIRADAGTMEKWTAFKTMALIDFTQELATHARLYRPDLLTARNIYAPVALDPENRTWFAQDYDRFLDSYDYTAVMAMPRLEDIPEAQSDAWLKRLVVAASRRANGLQHTIFELQAVDWRKQAKGESRAIPAETLDAEMQLLTREGAVNFGYYPDDFVTNTPDTTILYKDFSLQTHTYQP